MIVKTDAIVLRYYPVSNSSRMVVWLTRDRGKTATLIKGSQRPKSPFLGQYDLFYTCELIYYAREGRDFRIARECAPLKLRPKLRHDWKAAAAASYFCDLTARACPADAVSPGLFELLDRNLDDLHDHGALYPLVFWYELKLLDHLGFTPRLQHCLTCNQSLEPGRHHSRFSYARGGILCRRCARESADQSVPIAADVLATLRGWQRSNSPQTARTARCTNRQIDEMKQLLGWFLNYHLDTTLTSREIVFDVLARKVGVHAA